MVIYRRSAEDHEKRLQAWEIGYALGIDMNFSESHVYLCSSFTLPGAYFRVEMLALKLALLVLFVGARYTTPLSPPAPPQYCILHMTRAHPHCMSLLCRT